MPSSGWSASCHESRCCNRRLSRGIPLASIRSLLGGPCADVGPLGLRRALRRGRPIRRAPPPGAASRLTGQRRERRGLMTLSLQLGPHRSRTPRGCRLASGTRLPSFQIALCLPSHRGGRRTLSGRRQRHARPPSFGEADRDRLLRRTGTVCAFADVTNLLADELPSLGTRRLTVAFVLAGSRSG